MTNEQRGQSNVHGMFLLHERSSGWEEYSECGVIGRTAGHKTTEKYEMSLMV